MRPRMMWQKPRSVMSKRLIMLLTTRAMLQRLELRGSWFSHLYGEIK